MPPATWYWKHRDAPHPLHCSPLQLIHPQRVLAYLHKRDTVWRSADLSPRWAGTSLAHAARGWKLLGHKQSAFGTTILRHCLDKCWHGRNRAKGLRDPTEAAAALACPHCTYPEDQMHSILHCPHQDLDTLRRAAIEQLHRTADDLLQNASITAEPLLISLIHFISDRGSQFNYDHIDRIWLGTWNTDILLECLMYRRPPTYQPPSLLPISLIRRFDRIAAQLQSTLLKHFLLLHATAQKRPTPTISPRHLPIPTSSPPPLQPPRSSQRRLTDIWQLPPPYIADRPTPAAVARTKQRPLTAFFSCTPAAPSTHLPPTAAASGHTPAPTVLQPPSLRVVQTSHRRRRTHVPTPSLAGTRGAITNY